MGKVGICPECQAKAPIRKMTASELAQDLNQLGYPDDEMAVMIQGPQTAYLLLPHDAFGTTCPGSLQVPQVVFATA